jgi:hypothetical protein
VSVWAKKWAYEQHPVRLDDEGNLTDKKHPGAKSVLVALAEYPGVGQRECWPSQKTLATMTDLTERQVRRCLADLEAQQLIKRTERRRRDGTRSSDLVTLCGPLEAFGPDGATQRSEVEKDQPDESAGSASYQPDERADQPDEPSGHEPSGEPVEDTSSREESSNESSSLEDGDRPENGNSSPSAKVKAQDIKQFAVAQLLQRVSAARARGVSVHSPTTYERKQFGHVFAQASKDGHEVDELLLALDYQVAKACGEVEGEPKAWCGFRTALDRVLEGWRPARSKQASPGDTEHWAQVEENERMLAELIEGMSF